jgi:hypothetical protein
VVETMERFGARKRLFSGFRVCQGQEV